MEHDCDFSYTPAQQKVFPIPEEWPGIPWRFEIVPKGRRTGITRGAAQACIEYLLHGVFPILWVDVINKNIDKYFELYFRPALKKNVPAGWWRWNQQKRILNIRNIFGGWSHMDFASADAPESIEGFGYKLIFLNEAGIILSDDYLYSRAILPMMMDYPDSKLIAAGVPKGKTKKNGLNHKFYDLYLKAQLAIEAGKTRYKLVELTSYDNPILGADDIAEIESEVSPAEAEQEIMGRFVDIAGRNPFAHQYDPQYHESDKAIKRPGLPLIISIDFNLNPFAVIFSHIWKDRDGLHDHTFDEASIPKGSVPAMIDLIKERYGPDLANCKMTGDVGGNNEQLSMADRASFFMQLKSGLRLKDKQIIVPRPPRHYVSRNDVNYILKSATPDLVRGQVNPEIDFKINPKTCPNLCRDMMNVQVDAWGEIVKKNRKDVNQQADFLDAKRYKINTFWKKWIIDHQRRRKLNKAA